MDDNKNIEDKDVAYSPASDTDTESMQNSSTPPTTGPADPDIDYDAVNVLPGTGGPDDEGDVEVDPDELPFSPS